MPAYILEVLGCTEFTEDAGSRNMEAPGLRQRRVTVNV